MKNKIGIFLVILIMALSCLGLAGCDSNNGKQIKTSATWNKIMQDSYNALIKADANYKIESSAKYSGSSEDNDISSVWLIDGNKCSNSVVGESNKAYYEIKNENILNIWRTTNNGATYSKQAMEIVLEDNYWYRYDGLKVAGGITVGAMLTNGYSFNNFVGLLDFFAFADDKYSVKQEYMEKIYEEWFVKYADSFGMSSEGFSGSFTDFYLQINNGLISKFEFIFVSETTGTTNSAFSFIYGGQSVDLPEV